MLGFGGVLDLVLVLSWLLLGSGYLSCNSLFLLEILVLADQCYLKTHKSMQIRFSRCPHSCSKLGLQFSGFSAEIVSLYFWGFGLGSQRQDLDVLSLPD